MGLEGLQPSETTLPFGIELLWTLTSNCYVEIQVLMDIFIELLCSLFLNDSLLIRRLSVWFSVDNSWGSSCFWELGN
jgi:hypothetical protein